MKLCASGCRDEMIANAKKISTLSSSIKGCGQKRDCATLLSQSKSLYLENVLDTSNSKENALTQNALKALLRKREELVCPFLCLRIF